MPPGSGPGEAAPRVAPPAVGHADRVREAHQDVGGDRVAPAGRPQRDVKKQKLQNKSVIVKPASSNYLKYND